MFNLTNKQCIMICVALVAAFVVFLWVVKPMMGETRGEFEGFNQGQRSEEQHQGQEEMPAAVTAVAPDQEQALVQKVVAAAAGPVAVPDAPYIDTQTGTLLDGPGYEKGLSESAYQEPGSSIPSNYYFLDDGAGGEMSIQHNLCSKSCCSEQYPTSFKQQYDPYVCGAKDQFVPSNIFCNNATQSAGCLCLSKKQAQFLYNRGGNGREWF